MQPSTHAHNRTAVLMPNWLGDCLCALAVITRRYSSEPAGPALIVPPQFFGLLSELSDYVLIPYKRKSHEELQETFSLVRREWFERVYILPHSFSSALFAFRCGISERVGIRAELRSVLLTKRIPASRASRKSHLIKEYAAVFGSDEFDPGSWEGMPFADDARFADHDYTVFCPGARFGPAKQWPGFTALAGIMADTQVLVLGDSHDREQAELIAQTAPDRITNMAGETGLADAARILAGAKCVVANDSGLMHLAGYLGAPVVGIFCSTSPPWTHPLGKASQAVTAEIQCRPCFKRTCKYGHYKCHSLITPERVARLAAKAMKGDAQ
ncbi:MAG: lipopolysaccharide heptosyltransferase II [Chitinivibrionales bacterium]|nr:lipopolysaccharide heptosyltransferase II [Chitinivibrionales bacterium]